MLETSKIFVGDRPDQGGPVAFTGKHLDPGQTTAPRRHAHLAEMIAQEREPANYRAVMGAIDARIEAQRLQEEADQQARRRRILREVGPFITRQEEDDDYGWE